MAEIPKSWGLETKPNAKGTLDVVGKTDAGQEYVVRTTDQAAITDTDISELRDADRESYQGKDTSDAAWDYVHNLMDHSRRAKESRENSFGDEMNAAAEEVIGMSKVRRGFVSRPDTIDVPERYGYSHIPAWRWHLAFGEEEN